MWIEVHGRRCGRWRRSHWQRSRSDSLLGFFELSVSVLEFESDSSEVSSNWETCLRATLSQNKDLTVARFTTFRGPGRMTEMMRDIMTASYRAGQESNMIALGIVVRLVAVPVMDGGSNAAL